MDEHERYYESELDSNESAFTAKLRRAFQASENLCGEVSSHFPPFIQEKYPEFTSITEVAVGGMGRILKAYNQRTHRWEAIKILKDCSPELRSRMNRIRQELAILSAISKHSNIVTLLQVVSYGEQLGVVTEFLEGLDLHRYTQICGGLEVDAIVEIGKQIADALHYAHSRGVVHRDIKPSNVFLRSDLGFPTIAVLDFGIAKYAVFPERNSELTLTGYALGTPDYMAPEQAAGQANLDGRVDIYALGKTLQFMVAASEGNVACRSASSMRKLKQVAAKCCMPSREDRFQTCKEVSQSLAEASGARSTVLTSHHAVLETGERVVAFVQKRVNESPASAAFIVANALIGLLASYLATTDVAAEIASNLKPAVFKHVQQTRILGAVLLLSQLLGGLVSTVIVGWGFVKMVHDWWSRGWLDRLLNLSAGLNRFAAFLGWCMVGCASYVVILLLVAAFLLLNQLFAIALAGYIPSSLILVPLGAMSGAASGLLAEQGAGFVNAKFPNLRDSVRERIDDLVEWLKQRFALPKQR